MIQYIKSDAVNRETVYTVTGSYDYDITPYLLKSVEWNKLFSLILTFREQYNDNSGRFLKSDLVSAGIERYSKGRFVFIDENGCDFLLPELNCRIELKSGIHIFQTARANSTAELKLKNFNGNRTNLEQTFDYLLMVEPEHVGVISYDKLLPYVYEKDDGYYCKIHLKDVEIFKQPYDTKETQSNLTDIRKKIIESCLDEIDRLYE